MGFRYSTYKIIAKHTLMSRMLQKHTYLPMKHCLHLLVCKMVSASWRAGGNSATFVSQLSHPNKVKKTIQILHRNPVASSLFELHLQQLTKSIFSLVAVYYCLWVHVWRHITCVQISLSTPWHSVLPSV
jgi:hypothetical protein